MTIDSMRILLESASQIWQRLATYGLAHLLDTNSEDDAGLRTMIDLVTPNEIEALQLRRDYHRLYHLLHQIEALGYSPAVALELVRTRARLN